MSFQNRAENLSTNAGVSGDYLKNNGAGALCSWETPPFQQCAFSAYLTNTQSNVTGAGTTYVVAGYTEEFDNGSDFDATTGQFTVPTTGKYFIAAGVSLGNLTVAMNSCELRIRTPAARRLFITQSNPGACQSSAGTFYTSSSQITALNSGDVLEVAVTVSNGAGDTASVNNNRGVTWFCAYFLGA